MTGLEQLVRRRIRDMAPYQPILPFEVLAEIVGRSPEAIVKLDANENPYGPVPAARQALANLSYVHSYPDPESRRLRQALAKLHGVSMENLLAGAGADELIDLVMRLFIEKGEAIVTCPPTFGMYAFDGHVNGAKVISVPRRADFRVDVDAIIQTVSQHGPKLLFLATPNNPDGSLLERSDLERLLQLPVIVVLDEAYIEFGPPDGSVMHDVLRRPNLVVLRTFSKWAGLAGLRVGYGLFPEWMMPYLWKIKQPYNVSVAASEAALASVGAADELADNGRRIVAERQRLADGLRRLAWLEPYPSQANFVLCRVVGRDAAKVKAWLADHGILVRYFNQPGLKDHIRITVGKPEHTDALLERLAAME